MKTLPDRTCGNCTRWDDGVCACHWLDDEGRPCRYYSKKRPASMSACDRFRPRSLPVFFGVVPIPQDDAPDDDPFTQGQAKVVRDRLTAIALHPEDIESGFTAIKEAAQIARRALREEFWHREAMEHQEGATPLPLALERVMKTGQIGPRVHAALFDALAYGLRQMRGIKLPVVERTFGDHGDEECHPLESFIRALPPATVKAAARRARKPEGLILQPPGRPRDEVIARYIQAIGEVYRSLSGKQATVSTNYDSGRRSGNALELAIACLMCVDVDYSRHYIANLLIRFR